MIMKKISLLLASSLLFPCLIQAADIGIIGSSGQKDDTKELSVDKTFYAVVNAPKLKQLQAGKQEFRVQANLMDGLINMTTIDLTANNEKSTSIYTSNQSDYKDSLDKTSNDPKVRPIKVKTATEVLITPGLEADGKIGLNIHFKTELTTIYFTDGHMNNDQTPKVETYTLSEKILANEGQLLEVPFEVKTNDMLFKPHQFMLKILANKIH